MYGAVVKLGSQTLDQPDDIRRWFTEAGFTDIQITSKELDMVFQDEEEWWNIEWSISGRAGLEKLSPEEMERFKAEAFEKVQAQKQEDGFHYQLEALCTVAQRQ